jgi:hypothetical protein
MKQLSRIYEFTDYAWKLSNSLEGVITSTPPDSFERRTALDLDTNLKRLERDYQAAIAEAKASGELNTYSGLLQGVYESLNKLIEKSIAASYDVSRNMFNDGFYDAENAFNEQFLRLSDFVPKFKESKNKESLEIRVARVITKYPDKDMLSSEVAKLANVEGKNADGIVRGTKAWGNRKELRRTAAHKGKKTVSNSSGGYSSTGEQSDVEVSVNEPQAEHQDINDMIQQFQLGNRKTYPTVKDIAEKLSTPDDPVSEKRAEELLKETKSLFDY